MSRLPFTPLSWSRSSNVYEVNLRQYSPEGNFAGFSRALPRLRDMGVEVLWFMPITPISKKERKGTLGSYYASSDFYSTNPEYGSLEEFKALVKEAHQFGFKVIIDWVANHTGWDHTWTVSNPEYYKKNAAGHFFDSNGWDDVIDLDYSNPAMRSAMIKAMRFWVQECDIDGFRCDMAMLVPLDFGLKPGLCWIMESRYSGWLNVKSPITMKRLMLPIPGNGCIKPVSSSRGTLMSMGWKTNCGNTIINFLQEQCDFILPVTMMKIAGMVLNLRNMALLTRH